MLLLGAWLIGFFASGAWGIVPGYLSERFPTEVRGVGTGFSYHVGVGIGAFAPYLIGALQDGGTDAADGDVLVRHRRRRLRDHAALAGPGDAGGTGSVEVDQLKLLVVHSSCVQRCPGLLEL